MKKIMLMAVVAVFTVQTSLGGLEWGSGTDVINDHDGNPVATSDSDPTAGAFAQLIRILTGSTPFDFVASGSGISVGNEEVMFTRYAGQYGFFPPDGTFPFNAPTVLNDAQYNGSYYVRVFDAPAVQAEWDQGTAAPIPSNAGYYWQSQVLSYSHDVLNPVQWNFAPDGGQTLNPVAIPEPTTMILMVGGFVGAMAIRRKRVA